MSKSKIAGIFLGVLATAVWIAGRNSGTMLPWYAGFVIYVAAVLLFFREELNL